MVDRPPSEPETVWGACRALLQAGAGVAFLLEEHPVIGTSLIAVAVATAVYETVAWARFRRHRTSVRVVRGAGRPPGADRRPGADRPPGTVRRRPWGSPTP